ncbi:MAG: hypothetical protein GXX96_18180 [Planctomycetaceae bacterium]|nr:hypothetical protein [Planctomycetaceae bacterium]
MAIIVSCRCGRRFAARANLAGKTVNCPGCSQPLTIPLPQAAATPKPAIDVACRCGARFRAQSHLWGQQFTCPRCGGQVLVPDPLATPAIAEVVPEDPVDVDEDFSYAVSEPVPRTVSTGLPMRAVSNGAGGGRQKRSMPESAQMACGGLLGLGILIVILVVGIHSVSGPGDIDAFGQTLSVLSICLAAAAIVSAVMIWLRVPVLGQVVGSLAALGALPAFPIGTLLSVFILIKLMDRETQAYLKG